MSVLSCRREFPERSYERCGKPATHIVWGKLFLKEALGPRCEDCLVDQVGSRALRDESYAIYKLPSTPTPPALDAEEKERLENIAHTLLGQGYHEPKAEQAAFLRRLASHQPDPQQEGRGERERLESVVAAARRVLAMHYGSQSPSNPAAHALYSALAALDLQGEEGR